MSYGEVPKGETLKAVLRRQRDGTFQFRLLPELWKDPDAHNYYRGRAWQQTPFVEANKATIPKESGIYMFVVDPHMGELPDHSYIFYVGKANDLYRRYGEYLLEQQFLGPNPRGDVAHFLDHFSEFTSFHYTPVPLAELDTAEKYLKDRLIPQANTQVAIKIGLAAAMTA